MDYKNQNMFLKIFKINIPNKFEVHRSIISRRLYVILTLNLY